MIQGVKDTFAFFTIVLLLAAIVGFHLVINTLETLENNITIFGMTIGIDVNTTWQLVALIALYTALIAFAVAHTVMRNWKDPKLRALLSGFAIACVLLSGLYFVPVAVTLSVFSSVSSISASGTSDVPVEAWRPAMDTAAFWEVGCASAAVVCMAVVLGVDVAQIAKA